MEITLILKNHILKTKWLPNGDLTIWNRLPIRVGVWAKHHQDQRMNYEHDMSRPYTWIPKFIKEIYVSIGTQTCMY